MPSRRPQPASPFDLIYAVISRIPPGRVATYGQIAILAGLGRSARRVGQALRVLPEGSPVRWHRVINARGEVSPRGGMGWEEGWQRHLLEEEGVVFKDGRRVDLERFLWDGGERALGRRTPPARNTDRGRAE